MAGELEGAADDLDRVCVARRLGQAVGNARRAANVTSEKLAEVAGVARPTISNWENGKGVPDAYALMRIARFLDMKLDNVLLSDSGLATRRQSVDLRVAENVLMHVEVCGDPNNDDRNEKHEMSRFVGWMQSYASARAVGAPTPRGLTPRAASAAEGSRSVEAPLLTDAVEFLTAEVRRLDTQVQELIADRAPRGDGRPAAQR